MTTQETPIPTTETPLPAPEQEPTLRPAIWVASLLDHDYGIPHGAWIDANQPPPSMLDEINQMLAESPVASGTHARADRWNIRRCRGFGGYRLRSNEDLSRVSDLAAGLVQHGPAFAAWAQLAPKESPDNFEQAFIGRFDDLHAFMNHLVQKLGWTDIITEALPESIQPYVLIDIIKAGRDLIASEQIRVVTAADGGVWIFGGRPRGSMISLGPKESAESPGSLGCPFRASPRTFPPPDNPEEGTNHDRRKPDSERSSGTDLGKLRAGELAADGCVQGLDSLAWR